MEKKQINDIKTLHIIGRRWFDRQYGNTYHTAEIFVVFKDETTYTMKSKMTYGYGDSYTQTANVLLKHVVDMKDFSLSEWQFAEKVGRQNIITTVHDGLKREL